MLQMVQTPAHSRQNFSAAELSLCKLSKKVTMDYTMDIPTPCTYQKPVCLASLLSRP